MSRILIIDDMEFNRELLSDMLEDEYDILEAEDGEAGLAAIIENRESLAAVLLDIVMPKKDGIQVLREMKTMEEIRSIPVLIISSERRDRRENECFELGAADFIERPFNFQAVKRRVRNVVDLNNLRMGLEKKVAEQTDELTKQNRQLEEQTERFKKYNESLIGALGAVVEARNMESGEHIFRVRSYTEIIGRDIQQNYPEYGLTDEKMELIIKGSPLHDLGKIKVPDSILLKPGKLEPEEWDVMKLHTIWGCDIIDEMDQIFENDYKVICQEICRAHHERWDGGGYPAGISGDNIPLSAQIVALADVFDALVNDRVYKKAVPREKAYEMILEGKCGEFSPKMKESFKRVYKTMNETVE